MVRKRAQSSEKLNTMTKKRKNREKKELRSEHEVLTIYS